MSDQRAFALIPPVDSILKEQVVHSAITAYGREPVKLAIRSEVEILRREMARAAGEFLNHSREEIGQRVAEAAVLRIESEYQPLFRPVFNLTGTVIHTNLGRSRLPDSAIAAMAIAAGEAVDLEYNLHTGKRGDRDAHLEGLICELTGAEAATVVNNNAAAVVLLLNTLAREREVLISRGELVEIGGAFRIPDVMESAGAILREVGTTNRTHARDFESALTPKTALVMKVHASNYEIRGFTSAVPESVLADIAHNAGIPFVSDLGSGCLVDMARFGLPPEPTVRATIEAGADLVTFSGDKLLGGPQSGIIVGRADLIKRLKANPLKRALRVDKTVLAGLLSVLQLYRDPESLPQRLPLLVDLTRSLQEIDASIARILPVVSEAVGDAFAVEIIDCKSQIGSGALPLELMPSRAISVSLRPGQSDAALTKLAARLRALPKPIIGRLSDGSLILDVRCLRDEQGFCEQLLRL
ncbi:MAG TPA: L-seryl-tRNA(Sec) selenium transferase [Gammaproteobacteria bacterium]|jgi:L-seryl-tRNA(Ser) seleniumtransferase|nr:L-seryl-tRNA(Sec) selenium transferase [Gammaproteobacteria bacterium]